METQSYAWLWSLRAQRSSNMGKYFETVTNSNLPLASILAPEVIYTTRAGLPVVSVHSFGKRLIQMKLLMADKHDYLMLIVCVKFLTYWDLFSRLL